MRRTNLPLTAICLLAYWFVCPGQTTSSTGAPGGAVFTDYNQWNEAFKNWNHCVWSSRGSGKECGPGPVLTPKTPRAPASKRFSRPTISGVRLDQRSLDLLKDESEKLRIAGATKDILAWSPLLELAGENNAVHAAFSIQQTNWEELAKSCSAVDKTVFYSLATDARTFANSDATWGNPPLKQFWNAMADFYASQAPER